MSEGKYQGWTNWETWNVNLWLTNDQTVYRETQRIIKQHYKYDFQRVEHLRDYVCDLMRGDKEKGIEPYIMDDISLHKVNYEEIIEAFNEE